MIKNETLSIIIGETSQCFKLRDTYPQPQTGYIFLGAAKRNNGIVKPCTRLKFELLEKEFEKNMDALNDLENRIAYFRLTGKWIKRNETR